MGGKVFIGYLNEINQSNQVLVSTREHINRLIASRLQADIMGVDLVLVARTDALTAKLIDSNIDPLDQPYIMGCVDPKNDSILLTYPQAGVEVIKAKFNGETCEKVATKLFLESKIDSFFQILKEWNSEILNIGLNDAHNLSKKLGFSFYFDWEKPRTSEGYYILQGCIELCITRSLVINKYL